ncbi:MAG TPA: mechanosensitive ion channel [Clostridiales bacterium]|nr:mechanosensitive ion channel [Clostridiales bacterium]
MIGIQEAWNNIVLALPSILKAIVFLLIAWGAASLVRALVIKGLTKIRFGRKIRGAEESVDEQRENRIKSIGQLLYLLVFVLFIPSILDALNMESISIPISNMMQNLLAFIPNIIGALIILFIGFFVAKIIRDIAYNFLSTLNIDKWYDKLAIESEKGTTAERQTTLSRILSNVLYGIILIPVITMALETLQIETLTMPIVSMLNSIITMVPNIFVAIILILIGYYIAKYVGQILTALLNRIGIHKIYSWTEKNSETNIPRIDLALVIGNIVRAIIMLFITVEALNVLKLEVLNNIGTAIILYIPLLVSGLLIIILGTLAGYFVESIIVKHVNSPISGKIAKYIIIVFAIFMTLEQIKFASTIVNTAFLLILGSLAVAFAVAFGIGGRDFARRQLDKLDRSIDVQDDKD